MSCSTNPVNNLPQQLKSLADRLDQIPQVNYPNNTENEQNLRRNLQSQRAELMQSVPVTTAEQRDFNLAFQNQLNIHEPNVRQQALSNSVTHKPQGSLDFTADWVPESQHHAELQQEARTTTQSNNFHAPMMLAPQYHGPMYQPPFPVQYPVNPQNEKITQMLDSALDGLSNQETNEQRNDEDLSDIASQMLANLPLKDNEKLQNSQFVSWLRMVKDRQLIVQGNEMVSKEDN